MDGEWREIPGYPGYSVSCEGKLRCPQGPLQPWRHQSGHLYVRLGAEGRQLPVSRVVLLAFGEKPPSPSHVAKHRDGDLSNNRLENLCWGTQAESMLANRGEKNPAHKLTKEKALEVAAALDKGEAVEAVACRYGISSSGVRSIHRGETWGWATGRSLSRSEQTKERNEAVLRK